MDSRSDTIPPEELLAQLGWVRALARSLVADPDVSDDVLQQVCLLALQKAPREGGPRLRAWLATVTRRLAHHAHRASVRRQRREEAAALPEALASTADVALRREALRGLVDAVTSLDEPAYAVIVARYFEGCSVAEIAAQNGLSADAVRQRLARARQQLRARLQALLREDRQGWLGAALTLPGPAALEAARGTSSLGHFGGLLVAKTVGTGGIAKFAVGLIVVACLLLGTWYVLVERPQDAVSPAIGGPELQDGVSGAASSALPAPDLAPPAELVDSALPDEASLADADPAASAWPPGITTYVASGRVVDEHGRPWAGAIVRSVPDETTGNVLGVPTHSYSIELEEQQSTTTDEEGRFALTSPWATGAGSFGRIFGLTPAPVLLVQADGMALHAFPLLNHDGRDRDVGDLVLSMRSGAIVARLVDAAGAPIAGAGAGIFSWGPGEVAQGTPGLPESTDFNIMGLTRVRSDAAGRIEIAGLWPAKCTIRISHARHVEQRARDVIVGPGQVVDLGDIVMERGAQVAGVVRDTAGAPVAGAEVWAWDPSMVYADGIAGLEPEDWERGDPLPDVMTFLHQSRAWHNPRVPVTTDAEGRFEVSGVSSATVDVFVEAPGCEPLRLAGAPVDGQPVELVLVAETNLEVRVVDDGSGDALAAATLRGFRCTGKLGWQSRSVDVERTVTPGSVPGSFVVHTLGRHGTRLLVSAPGHATHSVRVDAESLPAAPLTVRLPRACVVSGRVEDAAGAPIARAAVSLQPVGASDDPDDESEPVQLDGEQEVATGADGAFRFDGLGSGPLTLRVRAAGFASAEPTTIDVAAGAQTLPPVILQRACGITGTLRRADGTPAAGLQVALVVETVHHGAKVDRSGGFALLDLEPGPYLLSIAERLGGRPLLELEVTLEPTETRVIDLVLPRPPVLRGRVTSGGVPVAAARVRATEQPRDESYGAVEASQPCDADGGYVLPLAHEGRYRLRAERPGGGASAPLELDVVWGLERSLDFELGTASLAGRVVDAADGSAPPGVTVRLLRDGEPATDWIATSDAGAFDIPALFAGAYEIRARSGTHPEIGQPVQLDEGQHLQDVLVPIARGAVIDGEVIDSRGEPEGAWVFLVTPGDSAKVTRHGAPKGLFRIEGLPAGRYRVVVADGNYADDLLDPAQAANARASEKASADIELAAGEQRKLTLRTTD
jgi:RNA polymerase sigma factor (sigma-70 family)